MAARTASELANWDGRLDQQRQTSKWRRSSSNQTRTTPLEKNSVGSFSDQRRAEKSAFAERDSLANPPANARLPSRVDTTSTPSHANIHHYHQASFPINLPPFPCLHSSSRSTQHAAPNSAFSASPFIPSQKSSYLIPKSSVHASRVHNSRLPSSPEHITLLQPATIESDVIDLTLDDTDDGLPVSNMLVHNSAHFSDRRADAGPSRPPLSSGSSSPMAPEQSLFTPPPPSRRRTRMFIAVPSFPNGMTKADYQPMSDHSVVPLPSATITSTLRHSSLADSLVKKEHTPPQKRKGKEREHDAVSSREKYKQRLPANADVALRTSLDAFYGHIMIPLEDDDIYPPLTTLDLATNTRFQFAQAWRGHASKLREAELDWMVKFRPLGKPCIWAQSVDTSSSPRLPGTAGFVSSEQLRPWELVFPGSSPQEKNTLDEQAHATESHTAVEDDANYLSLPDDSLPGPSAAFEAVPSLSSVSQGLAAGDMEHDMTRYFNGLSDSPAKQVPQPAPTHTFRPHLLQSAAHARVNALGLRFSSLELDSRLVDTVDHECFLGVPPSPPPADIETSAAPGPSFEPLDYFPASPSNIFDVSPTHDWSFDQEDLLPDNDPPSSNPVTPATPGTIDPSLLGPEKPQSQKTSRPPKDATPKRRSKLPEPVIYIRRPIDSSRLPLLSGKRSVQIKYRDSGGSPTREGLDEAPSNFIEQSRNDTDDSPRAKRRSVPSRKLSAYHTASESDSDYMPEPSASTSKLKLKLKRPSLKSKEAVVEHQGVGAKTVSAMSFCHQCRRTSDRPKMYCSNMNQSRVCGKRFCNRCILHRYPDITFDEHSAGFLCPACTNTCNCSACSRNRGEEFISMRLGGLAASLFKTKVTLVRDASKAPPRAPSPPPPNANAPQRSASTRTTPTPEPGALPVPVPTQFWAHVYGLEGDRVGSAFMTRDQMERLQTQGPSQPPQPPVPLSLPKRVRKPTRRAREREETRKGPRLFVGRPLASWKIRAVRDLEPSVDIDLASGKGKGKDKGKGKEQENSQEAGTGTGPRTGTGAGLTSLSARQRRCYVGNPAPLYEPYGRMPPGPDTASPTPASRPLSSRRTTPVLYSDGSLSPLSEFEAGGEAGGNDWPQPEVGECCSWAPPPGAVVQDPEPPPGVDVVGTGTGVGGEVVEMEVEMDGGDKRRSASTALSEEDLARAISAALAALSVNPPLSG
ncbi:hypothetical protein OG21DRAFT_1511807 [Imleria badia]|nr:hypothetical protein OG21DRAFT_1511807 [Imleria badia]